MKKKKSKSTHGKKSKSGRSYVKPAAGKLVRDKGYRWGLKKTKRKTK
jgi:hypothetical protein